jgi:hypothetical protein
MEELGVYSDVLQNLELGGHSVVIPRPLSSTPSRRGSRVSGVTRNFFGGAGVSTNSVEDRGQREQGSGGGSPLVRGSAQFANE